MLGLRVLSGGGIISRSESYTGQGSNKRARLHNAIDQTCSGWEEGDLGGLGVSGARP